MNERQQAHVDYFLERVEHWGHLKPDVTTARMLAARDDDAHPLRSEEGARRSSTTSAGSSWRAPRRRITRIRLCLTIELWGRIVRQDSEL
jgi:hypothetical protein